MRGTLTAGTAALLVATVTAAASGSAAGGRIPHGERAVQHRSSSDLAGARRAAGEVALRPLQHGPTAHAGGSAWQYGAIGEDGVPSAVLRAAGRVRIAVIDTGADLAAPDLAARRTRGYDVRSRTADVRDRNGHGTFVASLAAGAGGDAQLLVVKASASDGAMTDVNEAAGIVFAVDHGARIVNLSFGGRQTSATERRAIRYAIRHGALVVAAAGNDYSQGDPVEYPAALLQRVGSNGAGGAGLAVAASTRTGARAPFSNTGSWLSLAAPGDDVFGDVSALSSPSRYPRSLLRGSPDGLYGYASGTSFAAPQVAGAAALVWAADPDLTAQGVAALLKETASGGGTWSPELGYGVIDVAAAVARAQALAARLS